MIRNIIWILALFFGVIAGLIANNIAFKVIEEIRHHYFLMNEVLPSGLKEKEYVAIHKKPLRPFWVRVSAAALGVVTAALVIFLMSR